MYAVIRTGGKQERVSEGQRLDVELLGQDEGADVSFAPILLVDGEFPRAVQCCLMAARESVHAISGTPAGMFRNPAEQLLGELCSELAYVQVDDLISAGLHEYLDQLQTKMNRVGSGIGETFFAIRVVAPSARKRRNEQ